MPIEHTQSNWIDSIFLRADNNRREYIWFATKFTLRFHAYAKKRTHTHHLPSFISIHSENPFIEWHLFESNRTAVATVATMLQTTKRKQIEYSRSRTHNNLCFVLTAAIRGREIRIEIFYLKLNSFTNRQTYFVCADECVARVACAKTNYIF